MLVMGGVRDWSWDGDGKGGRKGNLLGTMRGGDAKDGRRVNRLGTNSHI